MKLLKVIGAGFGRTGTTSLKLALEKLGFGPCYHFSEVMRKRHASKWLAIENGTAPDWDQVFAGYASTTDWPAARYYKALFREYPDAKVILTVRDPDAWHRSICNTLLPVTEQINSWINRLLPGMRAGAQLVNKAIWSGTFSDKAAERDHAVSVFHAHCAEVRASIPADRLLEFDVREGWEPLCEFLDVPVPENVPFPRSNDTARMRRLILGLRILKVAIPLLLVCAAGLLIAWML